MSDKKKKETVYIVCCGDGSEWKYALLDEVVDNIYWMQIESYAITQQVQFAHFQLSWLCSGNVFEVAGQPYLVQYFRWHTAMARIDVELVHLQNGNEKLLSLDALLTKKLILT